MRLNRVEVLGLVVFLGILPPAPGAGPARPAAIGGYDPVERYVERKIEGWSVLLHKDLLTLPELADPVAKVLGEHLFRVARVVPDEPLARLRKVVIWVELNHPRHPCMCYHPSAGWLKEHGMNPQKAGAVEIANARNFLRWTIDQPWMVLHELAHAYHHQVLGHDHAEIRACYDRAVESKTYEAVLHIRGQKQRHYALNNDKEYFAEATEAYFGTNDFYPFVRAELKQHDPRMFDLLGKVWGVGKLGPANPKQP